MTHVYRILLVAFSVYCLSGCYHAEIATGLQSSNQKIEESFAACWLYGLIPPSTVYTASKCPNGVAKVETEHSFVNYLVSYLTLGIYTPISITVTCAEKMSGSIDYKSPDMTVKDGGNGQEFVDALMKAADIAVKEKRAVYIEY